MRSFSACHEVSPTIGIDAACTKSRLAGFSAAALSGTTANSAIEPVPWSKMLAKIASPGLKRVTRLPTSVTTPARSLPSVAGSWNFTTALKMPVGIMLSIGFTLAACTCTSSSSAFSVGAAPRRTRSRATCHSV
jgi:hypothetical protein